MEGFARDHFVEFSSSTPQSNGNILSVSEQVFIPAVSYENCKRPHRNYTPKHENFFEILISVCNFHISLQFSYQFAILTFQCIVPTWTFAIFIWVCNFHMNLQFSYQFAILTSRLQHLHYSHCFAWILCHYDLELIKSTSAMVLRGRQR